MLDLGPFIVSSFHLLLVELGAVAGLLPPFIQFSLLDFLFNPGWLEIHYSPLNCPMGSELKVNWYMASFAIDQLVLCLSYRCLDGCSICPECLGYHAIPSFPMAFTLFRRMFLIFLWNVSAWPLVYRWYGVAAQWFYSQLAETLPVGLVLWSVSLHYQTWLLENQSKEMWFPEPSSLNSSSRSQHRKCSIHLDK